MDNSLDYVRCFRRFVPPSWQRKSHPCLLQVDCSGVISSLRDRTLRLGPLHPRGQTHRLPSKGQRRSPPSTTPCTTAVLKLETKVRDAAASRTAVIRSAMQLQPAMRQTLTALYCISSHVNSRLAHTQEISAPRMQQSQPVHQQQPPLCNVPSPEIALRESPQCSTMRTCSQRVGCDSSVATGVFRHRQPHRRPNEAAPGDVQRGRQGPSLSALLSVRDKAGALASISVWQCGRPEQPCSRRQC